MNGPWPHRSPFDRLRANGRKLGDMAELLPGLKVHLGCGPLVVPGWLNVDQRRPNPKLLNNTSGALYSVLYRIEGWIQHLRTPPERRIRIFDLCAPFPLQSDGARVVFSSHVIEHLSYSGAVDDERDSRVQLFLRECRRILQPGGVLRLSTPDLDLLLEKLRLRDERFFQDTLISEGLPRLPTIEESFLRVLYERGTHRYCFNHDILARLLAQAGFREITKSRYGASRSPDIVRDGLDNREHESLFIEAVK